MPEQKPTDETKNSNPRLYSAEEQALQHILVKSSHG